MKELCGSNGRWFVSLNNDLRCGLLCSAICSFSQVWKRVLCSWETSDSWRGDFADGPQMASFVHWSLLGQPSNTRWGSYIWFARLWESDLVVMNIPAIKWSWGTTLLMLWRGHQYIDWTVYVIIMFCFGQIDCVSLTAAPWRGQVPGHAPFEVPLPTWL